MIGVTSGRYNLLQVLFTMYPGNLRQCLNLKPKLFPFLPEESTRTSHINKCWFRSEIKASCKSRFRSCSLVTYGNRKHRNRRKPKRADQNGETSFTCPSAAPMTAAAPEHAFRARRCTIMRKIGRSFRSLAPQLCAREWRLRRGQVSAPEVSAS